MLFSSCSLAAGTDQTGAGPSSRYRREMRSVSVNRFGQRDARDRHAVGKRRQQPRRQLTVKHDKDAAVVGAGG